MMQEDSMNFAISERTTQNQVITPSPSKSLQCSHCTLLFTAKAHLFEHLNKVHGFSVDAALQEAGLKYPGTHKANGSGDGFECQHCDFTAGGPDALNEHEKQCRKKSEARNVKGNLVVSLNPEINIAVASTDQHGEVAGAKEISSVFSVMSTSKSKCTVNSSKDRKTYKRPLQTITKYFTALSDSNEKPPVKLAESPKLPDSTKGTIILQESPSGSAPNSSGVFKVTAKSTIDITSVSQRFLLYDNLLNSAPKPKERSGETVPDGVNKRTNSESSKSTPAKKAKSDTEEGNLPEDANVLEQKSPGSMEFSFDISEDEGEKKLNPDGGDTESSKVYFCKHCDHSDVGVTCLSMHYQNHHPYIRYNTAYIQDPGDESCTFRCLQCPVEFVSVADLKSHYHETHPEAPNVLMMQSHELSLAFKCFACLFTTNALKTLKKHYKENHPTHKVDNSLMYCRYSVTGGQEESSQSNTCEKAQSPDRRGEISTETSRKIVKNAASPRHPTSTGADMSVYHCNHCNFSHKSVIVMHVHYQKCRPGEEVTIDTIKQSACVTSNATSQMPPDKSPNSVTVTKKSAPQTNISDSPTKTEDKAEPSQRKRTSESSKTHSESPKATLAESAEDHCRSRKSPIKRRREASAGMNSSSCSSPSRLFYCQFCSYSSINIRSVVGHQNAKHALHALTSMEDISSYSAEVQKNTFRSEAGASPGDVPSHSKTSKQVEAHREKVQYDQDDADAKDASLTEGNAYARAENLFYCQKCNFANPSVKGVANHQNRVHETFQYCRQSIVEHTYLIRDEIEKSKSQPKEFSFSTRLPLPIMNEGDEDLFFCHFCNYRQKTVDYVLRHSLKKHHGFKVKAEQVRLYTIMVREKTQKSPIKTTANREVNCASLQRKGIQVKKTKQQSKSLSVPAPPSVTASQPQRTLSCYRCSYSTQHVSVLRRHIWKIHRTNRSIPDVLRVCFKQGSLQAGYHCDLCVFSPEKAVELYEHYQEQHPERKPSLEYVKTRLYVGPDMPPLKKRKPHIKRTVAIADDDGTDGSSPSHRSGLNETKTYSCRACSFKSGSMSAITQHYRAVHPWSVKEDGSVLGVNSKRPSASRQVEDDDIPESFESYQAPLEFDTAAGMLQCPYCPISFYTQHGLSTHCGMKHHSAVTKDLDKQQEEVQARMHVFKCSHCNYVNSSYQGILIHCHMKHPALETAVYSHHVDEAQLTHWSDRLKSKSPGNPGHLNIRGYMCETCPQICVSLEKLRRHLKKGHRQAALKPAPKPSAMSKIKQHNILSNRAPVSHASFLNKKVYAVVKCQHCSYSCSTKIGLDRHLRVHHKKPSASKGQERVYKCVLCSSTYFTKIRLGSHYVKKHGRDNFLKYYAPVYKQFKEKPASTTSDRPLIEQPKNTRKACKSSTGAEEKKKIFIYRCPTCPYVNARFHGTLTHCQMKHPDLVARAEGLQTDEILETNLVGCTIGKVDNHRGYSCKMCPLIYASLKKLKIHCERSHGQAAEPLKSKTMAVSTAETSSPHQSGALKTRQSNPPTRQKMEILYKCYICTYTALRRRYLLGHYKKTHKLDPLTTQKLLQKYNLRKPRRLPEAATALSLTATAECDESAPFKCKKCPELTFDSSQLLIAHYSACHSSDCILDFVVLSRGTKKGSTGLYRCVHCNKRMNGIRKLWYHLDCHRESAIKRTEAPMVTASPDVKSFELCGRDELLTLETTEELAQWNVTSVQTVSLPPSPLSSSSKTADAEQPQPEPRDDKHSCKQCRRTFMSLKGLRSHERSHAAVAALKKLSNLPASVSKHNINKYVLYKAGTIRPFLCTMCSYRTTVMDLLKSHVMKMHQHAITDLAETEDQDEESVQRADKEPFNSSEQLNSWPEVDEEPEITEKSLYLEPPDVRRQLNHYSLMAQVDAPSAANARDTELPQNCFLYCEFCDFNTSHLSSIRRHYLNRHGKKMFRCKDCEFFTASRKTLEMHMETGHSTCQSEPTHQKDLRCPFCLYQTKNKNNMIDHIVLHREERVVPIEVRRSKLSRYLQGIVFRCHKCTFTSGSADNLRAHMTRHNDIKPYKCRLCYFDCTRLSDLEAHLSDKHQVVRNHELVGQVSLDELQARVGRMPEEEPLSNTEHHHNDGEDVQFKDCNVVSHETQAQAERNVRGDIAQQTKEAYQKRGRDGENEESPAESSSFDLQRENAKPSAAVQEKHEQDLEEPAGKLRDGEDSGITLAQPKEEVAEGSTVTTCGEIAERNQVRKLHKTLQRRTTDIDARVEDDMLRRILLLDEDVGVHKTHKKTSQDRTIRTEKDIGTKVGDTVRTEMKVLGERAIIPLGHNPKTQVNAEAISALAKKNQMQANNSTPPESATVESHSLTLSSKCAQLKTSHEEGLGVSFTNRKKEQLRSPRNGEEVREPYGEMPILENEYLKEEMEPLACCKEEDPNDQLEQKQDKRGEAVNEESTSRRADQKHQEGDGMREAANPRVPKGALAATDGAAEVPCEAATEEKPFTCEFCGRNLMNDSELERHVLRHGL